MAGQTFITLGNTDIKFSNIKTFSINGSVDSYTYSKINYIFRRKIWLVDDGAWSVGKKIAFGVGITAAVALLALPAIGYAAAMREDLSSPPDSSETKSDNDKKKTGKEYANDIAWCKCVDMDALTNEYKEVKALKGDEMKSFKANGLLSKYEAIIMGKTNKKLHHETIRDVESNLAFTKGKLCFNGKLFICEGSPHNDYDIEYVVGIPYVERAFDKTKLLNEKELIIEKYEESTEKTEKDNRYLRVTTFQNDNYTFSAQEHDIDALLTKLRNF